MSIQRHLYVADATNMNTYALNKPIGAAKTHIFTPDITDAVHEVHERVRVWPRLRDISMRLIRGVCALYA